MNRRREPRRKDGRRHDGRRKTSHVRQSAWATVVEEPVKEQTPVEPPEAFDENITL